MTTLSEWRRNGRQEKLSQAALADRLGISRSYLAEIEGGAKTPGLALALRIERETSGAVRVSEWAE